MKLITSKGNEYEIADKDILTNDPVFDWEYNQHRRRMFIIGHEYGPIVALFADNAQDAFDEMLDQGYEHFLADKDDLNPEEEGAYVYLGNASEPCNLDYAWIEEVTLDDIKLIARIAEARGASADNLSEV